MIRMKSGTPKVLPRLVGHQVEWHDSDEATEKKQFSAHVASGAVIVEADP